MSPFPVPRPGGGHHLDSFSGRQFTETGREPRIEPDGLLREFFLRPVPWPELVEEVVGDPTLLGQYLAELEALGPRGVGDGTTGRADHLHALAASKALSARFRADLRP